MKASDNEFPKVILTEGAAPSVPSTGTVKVYARTDKLVYSMDDTGTETPLGGGGGGSGDVVGPASAVADRIAVFNGTTGKIIKDGGATIDSLSYSAVSAVTISSGTATLNFSSGSVRNFTLSMSANATLAVSNLSGAGKVTEFELQITQDATGGRTLAFPASFKALGGSDTTISSAANSVTVLSAKTFDNGTTWRYAMQESA